MTNQESRYHDASTARRRSGRLLAACGAALVAWASASTAAAHQPREARKALVRVDSQAGWVDTGIDVQYLQELQITERGGGWTVDHTNYPMVGADGHTDELNLGLRDWLDRKYVPYAPFGALLAAIDGCAPFPTSEVIAAPAPCSGRLFLRINDGDDSLRDNRGALDVRVRLGAD